MPRVHYKALEKICEIFGKYFFPLFNVILINKNLSTIFPCRLSMFINQIYAFKKQKSLFQQDSSIAYFDLCFWSKTLKNKLKVQNASKEHLHCKAVFTELVILLKNYRCLVLDTVLESLCFNCLSYLIL